MEWAYQKGDKMKVWTLKELLGELEIDEENVARTSSEFQDYLTEYIFHANIMFKELIEQLAQKEDVITLSEIKEARNINGS